MHAIQLCVIALAGTSPQAVNVTCEPIPLHIDADGRNIITSEGQMFAKALHEARFKEQWDELWMQWKANIEPAVAREHLLELTMARQNALASCEFSSAIVQSSRHSKHEQFRAFQSDLARDGDRLYHRTTAVDAGFESFTVKSFNGVDLTTVSGNALGTRAEITALSDRSAFFQPWDPLALAMLLNSATEATEPWPTYDLVTFVSNSGTFILEDQVDVNGTSCWVIIGGAPAKYRAFIAPELNFAVVRYDELGYQRSESGQISGRWVRHARVGTDFVEVDNGMWFPKRVWKAWFEIDDDGIVRHRATERCDLLSASCDASALDAQQQVVVPANTLVHDRLRNISYVHGDVSSIEETVLHQLGTKTQVGLTVTDNKWAPMGDLWMAVAGIACIAIIERRRRRVVPV